MSTPALIIVRIESKYHVAVCGGDGYLDHTGKYLRNNVQEPEEAYEIVRYGDFRGLYDDQIEYYGNQTEGRYFDTLKQAVDAFSGAHYFYLYDEFIWTLVDKSTCTRLYWYMPGPKQERIHLTCSICNKEQDVVPNNDFGNWVSEGFLGEQNLGPVCPNCQDKYTQLNNGECEIVLRRVDMAYCPGLVNFIKEVMT